MLPRDRAEVPMRGSALDSRLSQHGAAAHALLELWRSEPIRTHFYHRSCREYRSVNTTEAYCPWCAETKPVRVMRTAGDRAKLQCVECRQRWLAEVALELR
jgi:hypothetical protein